MSNDYVGERFRACQYAAVRFGDDIVISGEIVDNKIVNGGMFVHLVFAGVDNKDEVNIIAPPKDVIFSSRPLAVTVGYLNNKKVSSRLVMDGEDWNE